ncbi:hypothetical protein PIROE2DRAFT_12809 [Piromyces sp. E2]|nr:hypothetical protein PIROE2DRAFT_12809 [Piromyces sp. E2]|eukprot:OUM61228.1 hypothetical protein PIROE2DRAFT_12809 [Piromyces sp. E2]
MYKEQANLRLLPEVVGNNELIHMDSFSGTIVGVPSELHEFRYEIRFSVVQISQNYLWNL